MLAITIVLAYFTVSMFTDVNLKQLQTTINQAQNESKLVWLFIMLILLAPLFRSIFLVFSVWIRLREKHIKVSIWNWLSYIGATVFITAITPFAIGSEPYAIFWIESRGVSTKEASVMVVSISLIRQIANMLITIPCFIYVMTFAASILMSHDGVIVFSFILSGVALDLIVLTFLLTLALNQNIHFYLSLWWNKVKTYIGRTPRTYEEIKAKYKTNQEFKTAFLADVKVFRYFTLNIILYMVYDVFEYIGMFLAIKALFPTDVLFNQADVVWQIFSLTAIAIVSNNFIPMPGGEGSTQVIMQLLFSTMSNNFESIRSQLGNIILLWRSFSFYVPATLGFILIVMKASEYLINQRISKVKQKQGKCYQ